MRPSLFSLLALLPLVPAGAAHAHTGDEVYFFYELLDKDLDRISLTDGSVEDWLEVVAEPSLFTSDFWEGSTDYPSDPKNLDIRVWLAWHRNTSTLWSP
ncbi:MAG: hypothetical protein OXG13_13810 [Gemmatimonadaceae bacterium]|nr:hypothetical protein [Gemmatimonadaceae bacterium]